MGQSPAHKVLNFFRDDENSCALTILVSQTRFHLIADVDNLNEKTGSSAGDSDTWKSYSQLLSDFKRSIEGEDCGSRDESIDSGVDVGISLANGNEPQFADGVDAETALYEWLISPLRSEISETADASPGRKLILSEWYTLPARFYNLKDRAGKLYAEEIESTPDLEQRMAKLCPHLSQVPKYIRDIDVQWFSSDDLRVTSCSNSPPPYHPTIVELLPASSSDAKKHSLFFKSVDNANIQPTKREINLLHQIEKKGLHEKIRCPRLEGIVTQKGDKSSIMGFLQTVIPDPIPLTEKFESHIRQDKREKWAKEAEEIKEVLHDHGIIWGDAKGDNFVVDSSDELWIIDFGGSYTEGWIDPEIAETKKGDDMGVEKVVNALRDPDRNVAHESEDGAEKEYEDEDKQSQDFKGSKRKAVDDEQPREVKKQRTATTSGGDISDRDGTTEPSYCYCGGVSSGQMIGCDGSECQMEWFHLECTGLAELPGEDEPWVCRNCESP